MWEIVFMFCAFGTQECLAGQYTRQTFHTRQACYQQIPAVINPIAEQLAAQGIMGRWQADCREVI